MRDRLLLASVAMAVLASAGSFAEGCSVPVFRYALEHWQPDPYLVWVIHRGGLTPEQQTLVERLTPQNVDGRRIANVEVKSIDLDSPLDDAARGLGEKHSGEALPRLVVQKPLPGNVYTVDVWAGELTEENVARLIDSPLRRAISKQLLAGESVVWVLLESGDETKDDAAWGLLNGELKRLRQTLTLPPIDPADAAELTVPPESLKLSFTTHRLSRETPEERLFIEMLLSVEPELRTEEYGGEPMVFPIFGRGCALYVLLGEGINSSTIEEAARFLTGGCQCTVKQLNPGVDLLLPVDWSLYVEPTVPLKTTLPPLVGLQGFGDDTLAAASPPAAETVMPRPAAVEPAAGETAPVGVAQAPAADEPVVAATKAPVEAEPVPVAPRKAAAPAAPRPVAHATRFSLLAIVGVVVVGSVLFLAISRR
jgi:hypothetical protein